MDRVWGVSKIRQFSWTSYVYCPLTINAFINGKLLLLTVIISTNGKLLLLTVNNYINGKYFC